MTRDEVLAIIAEVADGAAKYLSEESERTKPTEGELEPYMALSNVALCFEALADEAKFLQKEKESDAEQPAIQ